MEDNYVFATNLCGVQDDIAGFEPAAPGSTPGGGIFFQNFHFTPSAQSA
jgi:hypothetical protein